MPENIPNNLKWLRTLGDTVPDENTYGFPVRKLLLCEGITEETLLPVFSKICGYDFNKNGVYIISAGGKNQVVKYFYSFADRLKIPVFILLDNDAKSNLEEIKPKLREFDRIHLLKNGEFEDMLPNSLIIKTLNYATQNISLAPIEGLENCPSKVEFLEEFLNTGDCMNSKKLNLHSLLKKRFTI